MNYLTVNAYPPINELSITTKGKYKMYTLNVTRDTSQVNPICEFRFQDPTTVEHNPCKIVVRQSRLLEFLNQMDQEKPFVDPEKDKVVYFRKQGNDYILDTIVQNKYFSYTLKQDEKRQIFYWMAENL